MNISPISSVSVNSNSFTSRMGMASSAMMRPSTIKAAGTSFKGGTVIKWITDRAQKIKEGVQTFFKEGFGKKIVDFFKAGYKSVKGFFTPKKSAEAPAVS